MQLEKMAYAKNIQRKAEAGDGADLIRERRQGGKILLMCSGCRGFYSKTRIYKHKKLCKHSAGPRAESVDFSYTRPDGVFEEFQKNVLDKFRDDDVGRLCKTDSVILRVGQKFWAKSIKRGKLSCQI